MQNELINMRCENCKDYLLTTGPSRNFLSHTGTPCVSSCMAYAIQELVPTWLRVLSRSGMATSHSKIFACEAS